MNDFNKKLSTCRVIYKMSTDNSVPVENQRATVVGFEENGTYRLGVTLKSLNADMNKYEAKKQAGRRAMFYPTAILPVKRIKDSAKSKELHRHMKRLKNKYDKIGLTIPCPTVPIVEGK